jgi:hypothetical protein
MPTREEKIAFLKQKQGGGEAEPSGSAVDRFAKSITSGSDIGENIPGGHAIADLGTKMGAGIAASLPPYNKPFSERYDEAMAPSLAKREGERAADEASPAGSFVKSSLAGLPLGAMKSMGAAASAAAPAATVAAEQVATKAPVVAEEIASQAPAAASKGGWLSGSSTAGKTAEAAAPASKGWLSGTSKAGKEVAAEAEAMVSGGEKTEKVKQHLLKKYGPAILEQSIEFLPYYIRAPLRAALAVKKAAGAP